MDSDDDGSAWALPSFQPEEALHKLKRELQALGLTERAGRFERRGTPIARAMVDGAVIRAARVKRPSRTSPEWQDRALKHSADLRNFVAELKKQLALWSDHDD